MNWWILRRTLHVSWLIAILCGAFVIGIWAAQYSMFGVFAATGWLICGVIVACFALFWGRLYIIPLVIASGLILGAWRGVCQRANLDGIRPLYGYTAAVHADVTDDVDSDASGQAILRLAGIVIAGRPIEGSMWVSAGGEWDIKRGDKVEVDGKIGEGFGSFVATMYRAKVVSVQRPEPGDIARVARDWFADGVRRAIPEPQASLGVGYLVGQRRSLPADLSEALRMVGLTHVVVASGYNLTILVRLARRLFEKVSKFLSALSAVAMILGFISVTGMSPSMSRAGLVASLSLAAWYYGRKFHPIILLVLAAAITAAINPSYLWGDLGWQLSFASFAGVMILAPLLHGYFFGDRKPGTVMQIMIETLSAFLVTTPISIVAFGQVSNVAIISNILVLPLVPLAMLLTFVAGVGSLAIPSVATVVGLPATWLLGYMVGVAKYLAGLPWATSAVTLNVGGLAICYTLLAVICLYLWKATRLNLRDSNVVE